MSRVTIDVELQEKILLQENDGSSNLLCSPNDGGTFPLHQRRRQTSKTSISSPVVSPDSEWNSRRGMEMTRDDDDLFVGLLDKPFADGLSDGLTSEFKLNGKWTSVKIGGGGISWELARQEVPRNSRERRSGWIPLTEVIAAEHVRPKESWNCTSCADKVHAHKLVIHTFTRKEGNRAEWIPSKHVFTCPDGGIVANWASHLGILLSLIPKRPKKLWVFVNPCSGRMQGKKTWQHKALPMLQLAGVSCTVTMTTHKDHAYTSVKECAREVIASYDGIVAVGGDGFFQEIVNGILNRCSKPWEDPDGVHRSIRLGHIPAGSTDAICWSMHGTGSVPSTVMRIILGDQLPLDVMRVSTKPGSTQYSTCMVGYGFFGDTIRASDNLRFLGPVRYDIAGALVLMMGRSHQARVMYKPAVSHPPMVQNVCVAGCPWCKEQQAGCMVNDAESQLDISLGTFHADGLSQEVSYEEIEGDFMSIVVCVTSCRNLQSCHGVTPHAHLGDGRMHIMVVRKTSQLGLLKWLLSISKDGVQPGQLNYVDVIDATAVRIEPIGGRSAWNVDGELVNDQELRAHVLNGLLQVFSRGIEI